MAKYIPLKDCPVCGSNSGKCRSVEDGGKEFILCMGMPDEKFGSLINGWKCIKSDDGQHSYAGSTWILDNSREWSDERQREWELERARKRQEKAREEKDRLGRSLPATERDRLYRRLLAELELHPEDRKNLLSRGFTPDEIERIGFKSINRNHKLSITFNPALPGIAPDGTHLTNSGEGYLCPIPNSEGLIIGCQIRLRDVPAGENRYRWLSSGRGENLATLELPIGENPIGFYPPSGKPNGIALIDSVGVKAYLTAIRTNHVTIGAASGQFTASCQQFSRYLSLAKQFCGSEITAYPDAGDVLNDSVMKRWWRIGKKLAEWGYSLRFAWWGQVTKEADDVDELPIEKHSEISYLSLEKFWEIARTCKQDHQNAQAQQKLNTEIERENQIYKSLTSITEIPWKVVNEPKINIKDLIEPGAIYIVSSAKGTAKTENLKPIVDKYKACYAWFSRIALGREECHRIGLTWKDDNASFGRGKKRGFCSDSAYQFDPKFLSDNGLLIIDECDQVFEHNFGQTCNKDGKRPLILATLEAHLHSAIAGNGNAIFLSADVSQRDIDYIKSLAPSGCPVRLIVNEYRPPKGDLYFDESPKPDALIESLLMQLESGDPCFVIDDIKNGVRGCKSIAEYIRTIHPEWQEEIVEINSDTSGDSQIIEFLKNINEASQRKRLICCSPSVVSGISITNGRFIEGVYGFCNGVLTVSQMAQALARVRGAKAVRVWAAEKGLLFAANNAIDPREIAAWQHRNYEANSKHIITYGTKYDPILGEWSSPHWWLKCQSDAYRNLCMNKLRERLKAKLEEEGYTIHAFSSAGSDMVREGLKGAWSKIEVDYAEAVADANILTESQLEALQYQSEPLTPEEKLDLEKTLLLKAFGEELIQATTFLHKESGKLLTGYAAMYLKNERGEYRRKLENFYLLASDPGEALAKDLKAEERQIRHGFGRFPGDVTWRLRQRKAREWLGLPEFLNPERWSIPTDYRDLEAKAKEKAGLLRDTLKFNPEKLSGSQIFTELMAQLGLDFEKEWVPVLAGQKRYKRRRISAESWQFAQMYVAYRESLKAQSEEAAVEPLKSDSKLESQSGITPSCDHPPLNLYRKPLLEGGVISDFDLESQRELISDPDVATAIEWLLDCEAQGFKELRPILSLLDERRRAVVWAALPSQRRSQLKAWSRSEAA